jgi:hypothetical protein
MAKVTLVFAVLMIALGLYGFHETGKAHPAALIPAGIGLALGVCGALALSPDERKRKHFMHINATIGLVSFLLDAVDIFHSCSGSKPVDLDAMVPKLALLWLLFIYLVLCVSSFMSVRRSRTP